MTPSTLTGRDFEAVVVEQNDIYERNLQASIGRYGVQATFSKSPITGKLENIIHRSLPDFEGTMLRGTHIIFDCKVCSAASFSWTDYRATTKGSKARQLNHMIRRSRFGAFTFFLMHWNERVLQKKVVPAETWIFPVNAEDDYWHRVQFGEVKSMNLEDCRGRGSRVHWVLNGARGSKYRPDYLDTVVAMLEEPAPATLFGDAL